MLHEAGGVLSESERPLGYAAILITILGLSAIFAYILTVQNVSSGEAIAFGILLAVLGLGAFYLALALRRSAAARAVVGDRDATIETKSLRIAELERECLSAKGAIAAITREKDRLEERARAAEGHETSLAAQLASTQRALDIEKQSTERAKIAPAMDPSYRFEGHMFRSDRRWVGVANKGNGPAENVTLSLTFRNATASWEGVSKPYMAVLEKGQHREFEIAGSHFHRDPSTMDVAVDYDDMTSLHHRKSVSFTF